MDIQVINDKLRVKRTELQVADTAEQKQQIQLEIQKLLLKIELINIKNRIDQVSK